jgi:hypothetical protein
METKFQTSFIPKKPLIQQGTTAPHGHGATSILMFVATLLFLASLGGAGFTFFAKSYLLKVQEQYKVDLAENEKRFNVPLIEELKKFNTKIDLAKQLIQNHIAVSEALTIVSGLTAEKVYFSDFTFLAPSGFGKNGQSTKAFEVKMRGVADSFNSIAFQSDVFGRSQRYGTNKVIKNPILSDLAVDDKGAVMFNFSGEISLPDISYDKVLTETLESEGLIDAPTN